jgi:precorrin-6B methylase 2
MELAKPTNMTKLLERLEQARRTFSTLLQEFEKPGRRYVDRAPSLPQHLVQNCRVYSDRYALLEALPREGIVAEVGTDRGDFAARIMAVTQPRVLHLFEIDIARIKPENVTEHVTAGRCQIHAGDASELLLSSADESFDWIYLDAFSDYEGVRRIISAAAAKIRPGGLMVFNDYAVWSVSSMRRCGVAKAANEFAIANGWSLTGFAFQGSMYCDACFQKPDSGT